MDLDERITAFLEDRLGTAEQERQRADGAEAEVARLRALLERIQHDELLNTLALTNMVNELKNLELETRQGLRDEFAEVITKLEARAEAAEAECERLRNLPQQIVDALMQYDWGYDIDEDWREDMLTATNIILGKLGYRADDDSLWFAGAEWQEIVGDREEALDALSNLFDAYCGNSNALSPEEAAKIVAIVKKYRESSDWR